MKNILLFLLLYSHFGNTQDIEAYAGLNINASYMSRQTTTSTLLNNKKTFKPGCIIGADFSFKIQQAPMKFGISLIDYSGEFAYGTLGQYGDYPNGGFQSGDLSRGTYHNQAITINLYPVNLKFSQFEIALGLNMAFRIHSSMNGSRKVWSGYSISEFSYYGGGTTTEEPLDNTIGSKTNYGALLNISYVRPLKNGWELVPQFISNYTFIEDYTDHSKWMNMMSVGIRKSLSR